MQDLWQEWVHGEIGSPTSIHWNKTILICEVDIKILSHYFVHVHYIHLHSRRSIFILMKSRYIFFSFSTWSSLFSIFNQARHHHSLKSSCQKGGKFPIVTVSLNSLFIKNELRRFFKNNIVIIKFEYINGAYLFFFFSKRGVYDPSLPITCHNPTLSGECLTRLFFHLVLGWGFTFTTNLSSCRVSLDFCAGVSGTDLYLKRVGV